MTSRRLLVLLVLTVSVVFGAGPTAANATFTDSATVPQTTVGTAMVAAPGNVTARPLSCSSARWMAVGITWEPSASVGVRGYRVRAYLGNGRTYAIISADATETKATVIVDKFLAPRTSVTFMVTTLTGYGWTATSPRTSVLKC